jgi:hypothetical protein
VRVVLIGRGIERIKAEEEERAEEEEEAEEGKISSLTSGTGRAVGRTKFGELVLERIEANDGKADGGEVAESVAEGKGN